MNAFTKQHALVGLGKLITPIGSISSASHSMMHSISLHSTNEPQCEIHSEPLRFLCETCKKIVCQECTLKDHKDHDQTPISNITSAKAKEKLKSIHESSKLGIKFIKNSIDRAVTYSQSIERDSLDISSKVKKAFRLLILAAEDRERILLEQVDKYRQQKVANLGDQMTGLRSALGKFLIISTYSFIYCILSLAGLAETSEVLAKSMDSIQENTSKIDIAFLLANTENQVEKFAAMYKNLQPKEESLSEFLHGIATETNYLYNHFSDFIQPSFELLQELRNQGEVVINSRNNVNNFQQNVNSSNGSQSLPQSLLTPASSLQHRQPPRVTNSPNNGAEQQLLWDSNNEATNNVGNSNSSHVTTAKTYASIVKPGKF